MAEWDFESALNDYFGTSAEDGDTPLGVAGSATFSAPRGWNFDQSSNDYFGRFRAPRSEPTLSEGGNGWDFDKALNDYFGGVNGYVAPRGNESPDVWTRMNAPWEFSPPGEPPPPPSDYDQAVWFNALQRRHEAWDQAREQQELLRTPVSQLMTPQEQADWAEAYRRSQAHTWTPEQMTGFGYGFRRAEEQGDLGAWLERFKQYEAGKAAPAQEQPYQSELYQFLNRAQEVGGNALDWLNRQFPNASRYPGKPYGMTDEEYERQVEQNRQIIGSVANTLGQANEALDQVPILGGFKELANRALNLYPQTGGFLQQQAAERPEQTAWLLHSSPATELLAKQLFNLNLPEPNLQRAIQEARTNPLTLEQVREALAKAPEVYREKTHPLVQGGLTFFEPGYWALGLAGSGLVSRAKALAAKAADVEGAQAAKGLAKAGQLEEGTLPKVGDIHPTARRRVLQPSNNVGENLALAAQSQGVLEGRLREVERAVPGARFVGARVKTDLERIGEKLAKYPASTLPDYLGGRVSVDGLQQIDPVIKELEKRGGVVQLEPFLSEPRQSGYFGVHAQVKMPNGSTAEVQILPREIAEAKERADELYRIRRSLDISTEDYQRLLAKEKEIFDDATRKFHRRTGITDEDLARIERELKLRYSHLLPVK